jgi:hypothetical protein
MRLIGLAVVLSVGLLTAPRVAEAQVGKVPRIGALIISAAPLTGSGGTVLSPFRPLSPLRTAGLVSVR